MRGSSSRLGYNFCLKKITYYALWKKETIIIIIASSPSKCVWPWSTTRYKKGSKKYLTPSILCRSWTRNYGHECGLTYILVGQRQWYKPKGQIKEHSKSRAGSSAKSSLCGHDFFSYGIVISNCIFVIILYFYMFFPLSKLFLISDSSMSLWQASSWFLVQCLWPGFVTPYQSLDLVWIQERLSWFCFYL